MRKAKEIKIKSVGYYYIGKDKDFNLFLKSIIRDYLSEDVRPIPNKPFMQKIENQSA
ncbi:MAG: hypothetical protein PHV32_06930 [Eubacteriales bacterium]|nr:hypothetical protein [Eubacteriales bacterium]